MIPQFLIYVMMILDETEIKLRISNEAHSHVDGQQVVERHGLWNFTSTYTECRNYCSLAERSSL